MTQRPAILCARKGSKGLPGKNGKLLHGKPLIAWTIEQALASGILRPVAVSSDDPELLEIAGQAGADLLVDRPAELATDEVSVLPAIQHCLRAVDARQGELRAASFVYLQATSPLRRPEDIAGAVALFDRGGCASVITGCRAHKSPYFDMVERRTDGTVVLAKRPEQRIERRQDAPECFDMNGSIYVFDRRRFEADPRVLYPDTRLYEMPRERSIDIDTWLDFFLVEKLMEARGLLDAGASAS